MHLKISLLGVSSKTWYFYRVLFFNKNNEQLTIFDHLSPYHYVTIQALFSSFIPRKYSGSND